MVAGAACMEGVAVAARVIPFPTDRRPAPRPAPPPVNPYAELLALQLALVAEYLHALSAMMRGPR